MIPVISVIESAFVSIFGSLMFLGLALVFVFLILFLLAKVDFRYSALFICPMILQMDKSGWFGIGTLASGIAWVFIIGFGLFMAYNRFKGY